MNAFELCIRCVNLLLSIECFLVSLQHCPLETCTGSVRRLFFRPWFLARMNGGKRIRPGVRTLSEKNHQRLAICILLMRRCSLDFRGCRMQKFWG